MGVNPALAHFPDWSCSLVAARLARSLGLLIEHRRWTHCGFESVANLRKRLADYTIRDVITRVEELEGELYVNFQEVVSAGRQSQVFARERIEGDGLGAFQALRFLPRGPSYFLIITQKPTPIPPARGVAACERAAGFAGFGRAASRFGSSRFALARPRG
jgi:hypothetical protein